MIIYTYKKSHAENWNLDFQQKIIIFSSVLSNLFNLKFESEPHLEKTKRISKFKIFLCNQFHDLHLILGTENFLGLPN